MMFNPASVLTLENKKGPTKGDRDLSVEHFESKSKLHNSAQETFSPDKPRTPNIVQSEPASAIPVFTTNRNSVNEVDERI